MLTRFRYIFVGIVVLLIGLMWLVMSSSILANDSSIIMIRERYVAMIRRLGLFTELYPLTNPVYVTEIEGESKYKYVVLGRYIRTDLEKGVLYIKNSHGQVWGFDVNNSFSSGDGLIIKLLKFTITESATPEKISYMVVDRGNESIPDYIIEFKDLLSISWTDDRNVRDIVGLSGTVIGDTYLDETSIVNLGKNYDR